MICVMMFDREAVDWCFCPSLYRITVTATSVNQLTGNFICMFFMFLKKYRRVLSTDFDRVDVGWSAACISVTATFFYQSGACFIN